MEAESLTRPRLLPRPRRLLAALSDERLATEARGGNDAAFEVIYDRHHRGLLALCRHMLRSREDAEDALQQAFASAFRALPSNEQPAQIKPWLYTIARNRCLTMLRARRETPVDEVVQEPTAGLSAEVEQRAELRELLADLGHLPERQKTALVLSEVGALDHAQIAQVLECETKQVKALVFQARSALIGDRNARAIPCAEIREQLATASAGELRRSALRRHVRVCSGCAEFRDEIRHQRGMLALALPVVPSLGLKESALAAVGMGGGGAAGGGGLIAAIGAHGAAKVAAVAIATGGAFAGAAVTYPLFESKAQPAPEVADGVRDGVSGPSVRGRGRSDAGRASGSFEGDTAQKTARKKARRDKMSAPRDPIATAEKRKESSGRGRESGVDEPGRSKPAKAPHGQGRAAAARKDRSRGRRGSPSRGKPAGSPGGGGGKRRGQRRLNLPEPGANRRPERSLPRGGKGGRVPEPRGLRDRGSPAKGNR
jgi:RNA polymerase sigma factor (sigma-70 family)